MAKKPTALDRLKAQAETIRDASAETLVTSLEQLKDSLERSIAAREGQPGYAANVKELKAKLAATEKQLAAASA